MAVRDSKFYQDLANLGPTKLVAAGGAVAFVLAGVGALVALSTGPSEQQLLYAGLSQEKAGQVVSQLDSMGVDYTLKAGGSTIMVPENRAARIRMQLAQQGVPKDKTQGYEILDQQNAMGATDRKERVQIKRALEGELAQSVATIGGVESARVHVVRPEREPFSREAPTPEASVVVSSSGAGGLDERKGEAVQGLIASAVPKLEPGNVTVLDQSGAVLMGDGENAPNAPTEIAELREQRERSLREAIREVLAPHVGRGNVRATVTANVKRTSATVTERNYDPEQRVLRSTQTVQSSESSEEQEQDNVSAGQNTPGAGQQNQQGATSSSQSERVEETRNFEISNTRRQERQPPGKIQGLNVAVVVDGKYVQGQNGQTYEPRSDEEMQRIRELVRSAVGYSEQRGDQLSVRNVRFQQTRAGTPADADADETDTQTGLPLWTYAAIAGGVLALGLFSLFIWRVLRRQQAGQNTQIIDSTIDQPAVGQETASGGALPDESKQTVNINEQDHEVERDTWERATTAITQAPDDAAFVLQQMLARDNG